MRRPENGGGLATPGKLSSERSASPLVPGMRSTLAAFDGPASDLARRPLALDHDLDTRGLRKDAVDDVRRFAGRDVLLRLELLESRSDRAEPQLTGRYLQKFERPSASLSARRSVPSGNFATIWIPANASSVPRMRTMPCSSPSAGGGAAGSGAAAVFRVNE